MTVISGRICSISFRGDGVSPPICDTGFRTGCRGFSPGRLQLRRGWGGRGVTHSARPLTLGTGQFTCIFNSSNIWHIYLQKTLCTVNANSVGVIDTLSYNVQCRTHYDRPELYVQWRTHWRPSRAVCPVAYSLTTVQNYMFSVVLITTVKSYMFNVVPITTVQSCMFIVVLITTVQSYMFSVVLITTVQSCLSSGVLITTVQTCMFIVVLITTAHSYMRRVVLITAVQNAR